MLKMLMLCIFTFVLYNAVSSNQTESSDYDHMTHRTVDRDAGILDFPFFQGLRSPCSIRIEELGGYPPGTELIFPILNNVIETRKEHVRQMLQNFDDCSEQDLPRVYETVTLAELKELEEREALNKIYRSLVFHSAHSFIANYQLNVTKEYCSHSIKEINEAKQVADDLKYFACLVFAKMNASGYENDDIIPEFRADATLICSEVYWHGCEISKSTYTLLQEIQNYAVESIYSAHNSSSTTSTAYSSVSIETTSPLSTLSS